MNTRSTGLLSSTHLLVCFDGLARTTVEVKLDAEEKRRFEAMQITIAPLREESNKREQLLDPEATVRSNDVVVDRDWSVYYGVIAKLARLNGVVSVGTEAASVVRKHFPNKLDFTRMDTAAQAMIGREKLDALESIEWSAELGVLMRVLYKNLRKSHTAYEEAISKKADTVKTKAEIQPARKATIDAMDAFLAYVELMATSAKTKTRAAAMLAPVDSILALTKRAPSKKGGKGEEPTPAAGKDEDDGEE